MVANRSDAARAAGLVDTGEAGLDAAGRREVIHAVSCDLEVAFTWDYERNRLPLSRLYEKAKTSQWNAGSDVDWSVAVDPTRPAVSDAQIPIYGTPMWDRLDEAARSQLRLEVSACILSNFLHGEQGALLCTAQLVSSTPWVDAKYFAATQVMDEARHVEVFSRYLQEKIGLVYPVNRHLEALLDQIVSDSRWDMTYLGMQIMIEGLALAAFGFIHQLAAEPLLGEIIRRVMADEARHVAFGTLSLGEAYRELSAAERAEREDFCLEAALLMRNRFVLEEVWERVGLPVDQCVEAIEQSEMMGAFRKLLFTRIMPNLSKLGLLSDRVKPHYAEIGVLEYAGWSDPATEAALA